MTVYGPGELMEDFARKDSAPLDLGELERLLAEGTRPPWKACGTIYEHMNSEIRSGAKGEGQAIAQVWDGPTAFRDAQLIVAAVNALPSLIEEVKRLREVMVTVERLLAGIPPHQTDHEGNVIWASSDDVPEDIYVALSHARAALPAPPAGGSE